MLNKLLNITKEYSYGNIKKTINNLIDQTKQLKEEDKNQK